MQRDAQLGLPTGTGHNMGGLMFDPQGADFTVWVNRFKNEVYRNWIVPEPVSWATADTWTSSSRSRGTARSRRCGC